jgi:hypothetical protein
MFKRISVLLSVAPGLALGQAAPPDAASFAAVLQNAGHRQEVLGAAQATPVWRHEACAAAKYAQAPEVGVYAPVKFDARGAPVAGEWREGIVVSGCGRGLRLNVLTKVTAPSTLATGPLQPGETIADPVLQNVAQFYAVRAAGGLPKACQDAYVADTAFSGFTGKAMAAPAGEVAAPWREVWTLDFCGAATQVTLDFAPSAQGVSIKARVQG